MNVLYVYVQYKPGFPPHLSFSLTTTENEISVCRFACEHWWDWWLRHNYLPSRYGKKYNFEKDWTIFIKIIDLERRFADYKEHVDSRIAILQSENVSMKSKISLLDLQTENNTTEPGGEPCGYPCAEYISSIDERVRDLQDLHRIYYYILFSA